MIQSFNSKEPKKIWKGSRSAKLPDSIQEKAGRKLRMLNNSLDFKDLRIPPSNKLVKLKGELEEFCSIRVNDQGRIKLRWIDGHVYNVEIIDYH